MRFGFGLDIAQPRGAAAAPDPLAALYGTGLGQIPMDLRLDAPVVTGGLVRTVRNDGGAGVAFAGTAPAGQEPVFQPSPPATYFGAGGIRQVVMANAADVDGTMVFLPTNIPADLPISSTSTYLVGGPRSIGIRHPTADTLFLWVTSGDNVANIEGVTVPFTSGPRIYAARMSGGIVRFFRDGVEIGQVSTPVKPFMVDRFGYSTSHAPAASKQWTSSIGRVVSVIVNDHATQHPAIGAVWSTLAQQYGITLA